MNSRQNDTVYSQQLVRLPRLFSPMIFHLLPCGTLSILRCRSCVYRRHDLGFSAFALDPHDPRLLTGRARSTNRGRVHQAGSGICTRTSHGPLQPLSWDLSLGFRISRIDKFPCAEKSCRDCVLLRMRCPRHFNLPAKIPVQN